MARSLQKFAIFMGIFATIFAYLYHVPHSQGVDEMKKIRPLSASMKIINFIVEDTKIDHIPVRIYRSNVIAKNDKSLHPAIIYYHGGAFYMGSVDTHNGITSTLARLTNFIVISVAYRLAPEHPFPSGLDDCHKVTKYVFNHAKKYHIDENRIVLAGDSAGGNFAAVLTQRFIDDGYSPKSQVLIYPVIQFFDFMLPSYMRSTLTLFHFGSTAEILSLYLNTTISSDIMANNHTTPKIKKQFAKYVDWSLLPDNFLDGRKPLKPDYGSKELYDEAKQVLSKDISPLLVEDKYLKKLPLTYILSVGHDKLRDEAFIYAKRLEQLGVEVVHDHHENV
ncbi:unnamed protein product, partial [Didymodactylos carnosus]